MSKIQLEGALRSIFANTPWVGLLIAAGLFGVMLYVICT